MEKRDKNNLILAVIYCRKSKQNEESIDRQEEIVMSYIRSERSLKYCYTYKDDGFTGTDFDRPGWKRMMKDLERCVAKCLVVKDFSRIGRNYLEVTELLEETFPNMGVRVISIMENYDSNKGDDLTQALTAGIMNIANQYEADNAQMKVKRALRLKMQRNESIGRVPYGYRKKGRGIEPDETTSSVVKNIFEQAQQFSLKYGSRGAASAIVASLNAEGIVSPTGGKWEVTTVKRILKNPAYCGCYVAHKTEQNRKLRRIVPTEEQIIKYDHHTAIVSFDVFETIQHLFGWCDTHNKKEEQQDPKKKTQTADYLKGIVKCASCGHSLSYIRSNEKTRVQTAKYYCRYHTGTNPVGEVLDRRPEITAEELMRIIEACNACLDTIESGEPVMILKGNRWYSAYELKNYLTALKECQSDTWTEYASWYDRFCADKITKEEFIIHRDEMREQKARLESEIQMATIMENRVFMADMLRRNLKGRLTKMSGFDPDMVKEMVAKVLLKPDGSLEIVFVEKFAILSETKIRYEELVDDVMSLNVITREKLK